MNKIPKVVFSKGGFVNKTNYDETTGAIYPYASTWANAAVATDLVADITKLKQQEGKLILAHGGQALPRASLSMDWLTNTD